MYVYIYIYIYTYCCYYYTGAADAWGVPGRGLPPRPDRCGGESTTTAAAEPVQQAGYFSETEFGSLRSGDRVKHLMRMMKRLRSLGGRGCSWDVGDRGRSRGTPDFVGRFRGNNSSTTCLTHVLFRSGE